MNTRWVREQSGMALIVVLLMILTMVAVGSFIILAVDRNSEMRGTFQKNVAGFQAAEAGINLGAASVLNEMTNGQNPSGSDCNAQTKTINGRTVTYTLSGCGQAYSLQTLTADDPFAGLQADVYTYTLTSVAVNSLGFTEASLKMQFYARSISMFQFAQFSKYTLAMTPGPATVSSGRIHTSGDLYLDNQNCPGNSGPTGGGLQVLGPVTIVGNLYRGNFQSTGNTGHVWISTDGTQNNEVILGENSQGDTTCTTPPGTNPTRGPISATEVATFLGRLRTGVKNVILPVPGGSALYCAPWDCPASMTAGANAYWQKADLRLVLDLTAAPVQLKSGTGPALYPVKVLDSLGNLDSSRTNALITMMQNQPGIITYSDVPCGTGTTCPTSGGADCRASISGTYPTCEANYNYCQSSCHQFTSYSPNFPAYHSASCGGASFPGRRPRTTITASNYCYDYRYGGYYNWRDNKPMYVLNVDWMALEEYNDSNANVFFNPAGGTSTNNGVVIYLSVKGSASTGANNYAVRVYDAARARRNTTDPGVTFATDGGMLLGGTLNCPNPNTSGGTGVPETCGGSGYQKPVSIVGDWIDELSCNWMQSQDCNGPTGTGFSMNANQWPGVGTFRPQDERSTCGSNGSSAACTFNAPVPAGYPNPATPGGAQNAATSYYNYAFLAGASAVTITSGPAWANSPQLAEDWGPVQKWWTGSNVGLDQPQHSCYAYAVLGVANDPLFSCATYAQQGRGTVRYSPPTRLSFFDTSFNNPASWPPLTPFFVSLKQVLFTEPFQ